MKALVGIRKHLCVILVVQPQTQERHRDAKQLFSQLKQEQNKRASKKVLQLGNTFLRCFLI